MPDGGAVLSVAANGSQLLHGLGYTCDPADRHNRLLARTVGEEFIRSSPFVHDEHNWETPYRPNVRYRWVVVSDIQLSLRAFSFLARCSVADSRCFSRHGDTATI